MVPRLSLSNQRKIQRERRKGKGRNETARSLHVSVNTVTKYTNTLIVDERPGWMNRKGQSQLYTGKTLKKVQIEIKNKTYCSAIQLKKALKLPGSDRSFQRILIANKIGLHKHRRVPHFQPHHIQNRYNFAKETISKGFLPELCLFDDEKTVRGRGPDKYYRSLREENTPQPESKSRAHPNTVGIWGCVGVGFKSKLFVTDGTIDGATYTDAVINGLSKAKMDPPLDTRVLLSDNAGWHKKRDEMPRIERANIKQKFLPPLSSDLNPIEHVWALLSSKLYENCAIYDTVDSLRKAVIKAWNSIPQESIDNLVLSYGDRLLECYSREGKMTKY
ncbi:putative Transposable element Tc3 transposase [Blattamonas nauphoetae]|uniref:Transposable element Tc3 transposase n=1 Tax=Blattamonas nauphoetae TaxID=2049346 RepID=A0ABQ9X6R3_9EUKA|nr:putative Transposable element Tc3 transposase [Blattamonas nauphoetae]